MAINVTTRSNTLEKLYFCIASCDKYKSPHSDLSFKEQEVLDFILKGKGIYDLHCPQFSIPFVGIDSSFVETVNVNHSWQEVSDRGWKFHEAVAKNVAVRLAQSMMCAAQKQDSLPESFGNLSIADSQNQEAGIAEGEESPSASIEEPLKKVKFVMYFICIYVFIFDSSKAQCEPRSFVG